MHARLNLIGTVFLLFTILSFPDSAACDPLKDRLKRQAIERDLHRDVHWLALLHYRRNLIPSGYQSDADEPDFFLSSRGPTAPQAELLAAIDALFLPAELGDLHPRCAFPARFEWLLQELAVDASSLPSPECALLRTWLSDFTPTQVSVVLPTSFMNSPSSMFGHAFLRFDAPGVLRADGLLAPTISFAADTSAHNGTFDYLFRGLFGGFPSNNSMLLFHRMVKRYSDAESRDMWEYALNLTPEEMNRLILHVWELKDRHVFNYYFLEENCAYRLITLIEAARPRLDISGRFSLYTIPTDAIRALQERGAVRKTTYRASALKTFFHHAEQLNNDEEELLIDSIAHGKPLSEERLLRVPADRRPLVLSLASEFLALLINQDILDRRARADLEKKLFLERMKYDAPVAFEEPPPPPVSPDQGHKGRRAALGAGQDKNGDFLSLGYRETYHGLTDPLPGFDAGMQIELLNAELRRYQDGKVSLEKIDLINVASITPVTRYFLPLTWDMAVGRKKKEYASRLPVNYLAADWGFSFRLGAITSMGLVGFTAENSRVFTGRFGMGASAKLGFLFQGDRYSWRIGLDSTTYLDEDTGTVVKAYGNVGVPVTRNLAVEVQTMTSRNHWGRFHENNISIRRYF